MIIVIEGASAVGKTTWCRGMPRDQVLFEGEPPAGPAPPGASDRLPADPRPVAEYWANENVRWWSMARDISDRLGWVVCDTDPFKLHWSWTLWVTGLSSSEYWQRCREPTQQAFEDASSDYPILSSLQTWMRRRFEGRKRLIPHVHAAATRCTSSSPPHSNAGIARWPRSIQPA